MAQIKALFVYPANRQELFELYAGGEASENALYFVPSLRALGIDATFKDVIANDLLFKAFYPLQKLFIKFTGNGFKLDQALKLAAEVNRHDVVIPTTDACALPLLFLKKLGLIKRPVIVFTIGLYDNLSSRDSRPFIEAYAHLYRTADRIVSFAGRTQLDRLEGLLKLTPQQLVSVPLCTDTNFYRPMDVSIEDFIISVGRDPSRDYRTLFEVAGHVKSRFKVLTSPDNLRGLTPPDNVNVLYDHPMRATVDEICKSRFSVQLSRPNHYFAGHTTLLATMACGKLAVFNDSAPDLPFRDMENCVIVSGVQDTAAKVGFLLTNPDEVQRIARAGYALVTTRYHAGVAAQGIKQVIEEVVRQSRARGAMA